MTAAEIQLPTITDLGPKMLACTERERKFVWVYLINGGDGAKAARAAGYSDKSDGAKVRAFEVLHRERVLAAMHEVGGKSLLGLSLLATIRAKQILESENHPELVKMIGMVWSRTGFTEKTAHEIHHSGSIELSRTDEALEALAYLKSLAVPREKLIEQFGNSGLARYERLLEERDAKRGMRVIEDGRGRSGPE